MGRIPPPPIIEETEQYFRAVSGAAEALAALEQYRVRLFTVKFGPIGVMQLPDMIRIRVKPSHITIRIGSEPKGRYTSAIHALHIIRVAIKEEGAAVEETPKTQQALGMLVTRARDELEAAIWDVDLSEHERAVCVARDAGSGVVSELSYYQTTDERHLRIVKFSWGTFAYEDNECIRRFEAGVDADDAIRALGYRVAPVGDTV